MSSWACSVSSDWRLIISLKSSYLNKYLSNDKKLSVLSGEVCSNHILQVVRKFNPTPNPISPTEKLEANSKFLNLSIRLFPLMNTCSHSS